MSLICAALLTSAQERSAKQNRIRAEMHKLLYHFTDTLSLREMRRSKAFMSQPEETRSRSEAFCTQEGTSHSKTKAHYPSRRKTKYGFTRTS